MHGPIRPTVCRRRDGENSMAYALHMADTAGIAPVAMDEPVDVVSAPAVIDVDDDSDEALLDRLAAHDELAFRRLVELRIDRAFGIALRLLGSRADAEDVVQDTMLKIWTHRGQWEHGRAKFSTWLYRVVTNRCIDLHRRPRTDNVDAVPEPADVKPDAFSAMQRNEVAQLL